MMKSAIILMLLVAAIGLVTARPELDVLRAVETIEEKEVNELAQIISNPEEQESRRPTCCNRCTICTLPLPVEHARCQCADLVHHCHPSCKNCVQAKVLPYPPMYQCLDADMPYNDCHRKCNHASTTSEPIN